MTRLVLIICIVLSAVFHIHTDKGGVSKSLVISLSNLTNNTEQIVQTLETTFKQQRDVLRALNNTSTELPLANTIHSDIAQIPSLAGTNASALINAIVGSFNNTRGVLVIAGPLLDNLGTALAQVLQSVIEFVQQVLRIVIRILRDVANTLQGTFQQFLTDLGRLGDILINNLANAVLTQLTDSNQAVAKLGDIFNGIIGNSSTLTPAQTLILARIINNVLGLQNSLSDLIAQILKAVNALLQALIKALQGISNSLLSSLTVALAELGSNSGGNGRRSIA
ncbi:unnamed protein product [Rotaria sordida]|uniref:Uncharacterized protein n=1 Tax=Rotaria sordida TaxID=392033 RepID=A0A813QZA6_9BILA|nr:unnamed protein product [Rotaria sordida]CAF0986914.1 unnamed protein product [Rotaria sordida]CAF3971239.1 unnamed protein product [Rotaria sordida]